MTVLENPLEQLTRVAERLTSTAKTLEMLHTVDVHRKANLIGFLKSEAYLIKESIEAIKSQDEL